MARIPEYFNAACKISSQPAYYAALCGVAPLLGPLPGNRDDRQSEMLGNSNEAGFTNKKEPVSIARPSSPVSIQDDEAPADCDASSLCHL